MLHRYFSTDPLAQYYNLEGLTDILLTCDVDWAPDFAIESAAELVAAFGFKLTIFATHDSPVLRSLDPDRFEVGLHPDFTRPHSTDWFDGKIRRLKELYPDSVGMRCHRNFFGQNIGDLASRAGLLYDASVFLWNEPFCQAHVDYNGITRFAYMWEDGIHLDMGLPLEVSSINLNSPGLKILNIHPILIYLNSPSEDHRRAVTRCYSDLTKTCKADIDRSVHTGMGIRTFYTILLDELRRQNVNSYLLQELARTRRQSVRIAPASADSSIHTDGVKVIC